jgi:carbamoylphosphate synthase large subunit
VNSNPATIMTDPEFADRTYIEPMTVESLELIIARERPDVILPTLGGQTALNLTIALGEAGVLERYDVGLIGAQLDSIRKAEDRDRFREAMQKIGLKLPKSGYARSVADARRIVAETHCPRSSGRASRSAAPAAGSRARWKSWTRSCNGRSTSRPTTPAWSSRACSAGRSTSSR